MVKKTSRQTTVWGLVVSSSTLLQLCKQLVRQAGAALYILQ